MGLELGPCTRKSKVLPWRHARRTLSLPSTVHNFHPQIRSTTTAIDILPSQYSFIVDKFKNKKNS